MVDLGNHLSGDKRSSLPIKIMEYVLIKYISDPCKIQMGRSVSGRGIKPVIEVIEMLHNSE